MVNQINLNNVLWWLSGAEVKKKRVVAATVFVIFER